MDHTLNSHPNGGSNAPKPGQEANSETEFHRINQIR